jgi:FAD/FMN-containing dehydrogenase/Fe-S oxidoreductase
MARTGQGIDSRGLARRLHRDSEAEVRFSPGSRALYATDSSNFRQVPIGVVVPRSVDDVLATVAACHEFGAPMLVRGGGTSLAGQCCNEAVVIDTSKYLNHVTSLDPDARRATVEPGVVLDDLRFAAEAHHLTFGPDPSTHDHCTLGGMIGNNSCGVHSVMSGMTSDNIESLDVLTSDGLRLQVGATSEPELESIIAAGGRRGELYRSLRDIRDQHADLIRTRFPDIPRRVSGYGLDQLLPEQGCNVARARVGTESTCVLVLGATVRLVDSPPGRALVICAYSSIFDAADHVPRMLEFEPIGLEAMDGYMLDNMATKGLVAAGRALLPDGRGWLVAEFGADTREAAAERARQVVHELRSDEGVRATVFDDPAQEQLVWNVREAGLGGTAHVPGAAETWEGWEDSSVPPAVLGRYLRELQALYDRHGYHGALYGHFGDGCVHTRIDFDLRSKQGVDRYRSFLHDAAHLVVAHGGSLSGEHGDGQSRGELLPIMFGEELVDAFGAFKRAWDPDLRMNPGKVVAPPGRSTPLRADEHLRLGADYAPPHQETWFRFPDDGGSFAQATLRCVGVGECRSHDGGTMCPSYMATRDEEHSTRGRAHMLHELLRGDGLDGGWRNDEVRDALDLCLACKGCKGDCPVHVDMATYKAEFLAHYYDGPLRLRPRVAYSMGMIHRWARLARHAPRLVNFAAHARGLAPIARFVAGVAPARTIPSFARETLHAQVGRRRSDAARPGPHAGRVVLWPDTFTNHFHPEIGLAAIDVLERAGYEVVLPRAGLCCGRPLFDWGMLGRARGLLEQVLDGLRDELRAGTPVVGLEPSCVATFRDELTNLLPDDEDARRLKHQTFLLSEFLVDVADWQPPRLERDALVHVHCHHKSIMGVDAERTLLERMGLRVDMPDSGCCGMAGAFGFERGKHDLSVQIGERVLLPAVREAHASTIIVADGFSCREQVMQTTERIPLHPAQVLQLAFETGPRGPEPSRNPEAWFHQRDEHGGGPGGRHGSRSRRERKPEHMKRTAN